MKLSLGFSSCPNDTFMFDAMVNQRIPHKYQWNLHMADIKQLNEMAMEAQLDITKLSFNAFAQVLDDYELLNAGSALGWGVGPLLICKADPQLINLETAKIAIPGLHTTANFLLDFAFPQAAKKKVMLFSEVEDAVLNGEVDCGVIIHENRFTYQSKGLNKMMDLGTHWEGETGHPIPLGGIVIRRSLPIIVKHEIQDLMHASVQYAMDHPTASNQYVIQHAQEMDPDVTQKHIELYVNDYSLGLKEEGKEAIMYFLKQIHKDNPAFAECLPIFL